MTHPADPNEPPYYAVAILRIVGEQGAISILARPKFLSWRDAFDQDAVFVPAKGSMPHKIEEITTAEIVETIEGMVDSWAVDFALVVLG